MEKIVIEKKKLVFINFFEKDENVRYKIQGCIKPQPIYYNITKKKKKNSTYNL